METNPPLASSGGSLPPPKPWEHGGSSSGPTPFKPSAPGRTSDVVEASGTAKPGEVVTSSGNSGTVNRDAVGRPLPTRPWQQNYGNNYGGYGSGMHYGSGMYGSYGGLYGGGPYGNSMYGGYGSPYGGSGFFGGGMYNSGFGGPMGGYGMGMGGPSGEQDPNNPFGPPSSPPSFWVSFLRVMHGVVMFFGRISILIDQNTQAFHMFMTALLQLFDRGGLLYGELARFVLRLLGIKTKPRSRPPNGPGMLPGPDVQGTKAASNSWDNVWEDDGSKAR